MKRWSTKDVQVLRPPRADGPGDAIFTFSDRYSLYDFGAMPEEIPGKGVAVCAMAVRSFELLADAGIRTHFVEQASDRSVRVELLRVDVTNGLPSPRACRMIPLEVIYRNALPPESSVHRRVTDGMLDPATVPGYADAGSPLLEEVMVEFTTKFEETDRFVTSAEAEDVGGVRANDIRALTDMARQVNEVLLTHCATVGLSLLDGKLECGFDAEGALMLIDHAGTPDENRFSFDGACVGKEMLRPLRPDFHLAVRRGLREGIPKEDWPRPEPLPLEVTASMSEVYSALADLWTSKPSASGRLSDAVKTFLNIAKPRGDGPKPTHRTAREGA
jgi:phosphoribosylaminoimidazole-succinocarboxamide synthase